MDNILMNIPKFIVGSLFTSIALSGFAQNATEIGGEFIKLIGQGYNNNRVAFRGESFSGKSSFSIGITYQLASQKGYSVSTGFGIYAGYRRAFGNNLAGSNPFAGARLFCSFENFAGKSSQNSILLTPMGEVGYHFVFGKSFYTAPSIGYGYTFQLTSDYNSLDEDVGKRFIPSLSAGFRL